MENETYETVKEIPQKGINTERYDNIRKATEGGKIIKIAGKASGAPTLRKHLGETHDVVTTGGDVYISEKKTEKKD